MPGWAALGLVYLIGVAGFAAVAAWAGQDANWDLQNYHAYAAHALLNGRYPLDVGPGGFQAYLNPLPYVPQYLLRRTLSPFSAAMVLAALQATVAPVAWAITGRLAGLAGNPALRAMATMAGCTSAMVLSEIGTSFADLLVLPLVLGGLLLLLHADAARRAPFLWAGMLVGAAAGLKLTNGLYAVGLIAAALWPARTWRGAAEAAGLSAAGFVAGIAVTGGAWAAYLWTAFGNPVFPLMNTWFRSPSAMASDFADQRFLPAGLLDALAYPLRIALGEHPTAELPFADPRLLLGLPLVVLTWRSAGRMLPFLWGSALAWLGVFAIERYAVGLEMLAAIGAIDAVARLPGPRRRELACLAATAALVTATRPADFWHRPWADAYAPAPPAALAAPAAYIMTWHPDGYWVPALPAASRFYSIVPTGLATGGVLRARLEQGLRTPPGGRLWTMGPDIPLGEDLRSRLSALGVVPAAPCVRARSLWWIDTVFCRAAASGPRPLAAADLAPEQTVDFGRAGSGWIYEVSGWLEAGEQGVAAATPSPRLVMRPAAEGRTMVLALDMVGAASVLVNGSPAGLGPDLCLPAGPDVDLTFRAAAPPLLLRSMILRPARPGECQTSAPIK